MAPLALRRLELRVTSCGLALVGALLAVPPFTSGDDAWTGVGDILLGLLAGVAIIAAVELWRLGRRLEATPEAPADAVVETPERTRRKELTNSGAMLAFIGVLSLTMWPDTGFFGGVMLGIAATVAIELRRIGAWEQAAGAVLLRERKIRSGRPRLLRRTGLGGHDDAAEGPAGLDVGVRGGGLGERERPVDRDA